MYLKNFQKHLIILTQPRLLSTVESFFKEESFESVSHSFFQWPSERLKCASRCQGAAESKTGKTVPSFWWGWGRLDDKIDELIGGVECCGNREEGRGG